MKSNKIRIQILIWATAISVVIAIGLYYMPKEEDHPNLCEAFYSTLRLFVFERDLPHFPKAIPLIIIYFLAPLITLSALGTAVTYFFRFSPFLRTRWMKGHVVICGVGRTGKLIAAALKSSNVPVVGIDLGPVEEFEEWCMENNVPVIFGDFHNRIHLKNAGAKKARSVIFASGNDLANLEGALTAYEFLKEHPGPVRLIWAHVANEDLAHTAREIIRTEGKLGIRFFDTYRIAARSTVGQYFTKEARKDVKSISIMGFGKFGRDLLEMLARDLSNSEEIPIRVVDIKDRAAAVKKLSQSLGLSNITFEQASIQDIEWEISPNKAYFLCTDDDLGNLTMAMSLAKHSETTNIYVRMAHWPISAVAEHLGDDRGVLFIHVNELVKQGLPDLAGFYKSATVEDLKRIAH